MLSRNPAPHKCCLVQIVYCTCKSDASYVRLYFQTASGALPAGRYLESIRSRKQHPKQRVFRHRGLSFHFQINNSLQRSEYRHRHYTHIAISIRKTLIQKAASHEVSTRTENYIMPTNEPGPGPLPGGHEQLSRNGVCSARRVLGEVSPNIRASAVPSATHLAAGKPMAGSPLKRSFTAAMEGNGFKYFKKRKMSSETPLNQQFTSQDHGNLDRNAAIVGHAHVRADCPLWI